MFTGLIEEVGLVADAIATQAGRRFLVAATIVLDEIVEGASIAHNGVCLTVTGLEEGGYWVDAVAETLARSTLADLVPGDPVNLERPMRLSDRLGGHLVQGHVDGVASVVSISPEGESVRIRFAAPESVVGYIVEKGSVTVDGVSLTVTAVDGLGFEVAVIPHTAAATNLGGRRPGHRVNIEVDIIAKYVEKLTGWTRA